MPWSPAPVAVKRPGRRPAPAGSAASTRAPPRGSQPADGGFAAGWPVAPALVSGGRVASGAAPGAGGSEPPTIWPTRITSVSTIATAASTHSAT
jgi:hypothetical protein